MRAIALDHRLGGQDGGSPADCAASRRHDGQVAIQAEYPDAPLSDAGNRMAAEAAERFARQLPALLDDPLRTLSTDLAVRLLTTPQLAASIRLNDREWLDLAGFAFAGRGYETSLPAIEKLSLLGFAEGCLATDDGALLVMRVIQKRAWAECAGVCQLSGRRETETNLRRIIAGLFLHLADAQRRELATEIKGS